MKLFHFLIIVSIVLACTNQSITQYRRKQNITDSVSLKNKNAVFIEIEKDTLTKIYIQAISEFIKAAYQNDRTSFDTLYFGKHVYGQPDDFPDILLPETIENTQIRLISPELGQQKQATQKSMIYVNLMAWIEDRKEAKFLFVVFSNGAAHQYDYSVDFTYNNSLQKFLLTNIYFENYVQSNRKPPKRIPIYEDGKYVIEPK